MASGRNILLIAYHYPPINSAGVHRLLAFSRHLVGAGWRPTVVSVSNPHFDHVDPNLVSAIPSGIVVHRTRSFEYSRFEERVFRLLAKRPRAQVAPTTPQNTGVSHAQTDSGSSLKRILGKARDAVRTYLVVPDLKVGWAPFALAESLAIARRARPHVVLTSSPPHSLHLVGLALKLAIGAKWVADFRDPWTQNAAYPFASGFRRRMDECLENAVLRNADVVIANTETNRSKLLTKFPALAQERCVTITNGFNLDEYERAATQRLTTREAGRKLHLVYTGVLYPGMGESFFTALKELKEEHAGIANDFHLEIVGEIQPEHRAAVERHGLASVVECRGFLPRQVSLTRQAMADALLCILPNSEEARGWVPSKLYAYLPAGKPILGIVPEGEAAQILRKTKTGLSVEPNDVPGIKRALLDMIKQRRNGGLRVSPDSEAIGAYDWKSLGRRFVELCERLA
ncbi:MAG: glycosyltransferase family 4 protein [Planctomycetes bacterium]|nr:glycosyltransferase family 4 protein [Planctomycetota bacterium]